jgi:hypothetical protein
MGKSVMGRPQQGGRSASEQATRWEQRRLAGLAVRALTVVVPFVLAVAVVVALGRTINRPAGVGVVGWYAGLCLASWLVSWSMHRALQRLLPLAALLEMSLVFPDRAPSRMQIAKRAASNRDLEQLIANRSSTAVPETTQQAAERILALVSALTRHDRRTRGHSERVRAFTDLIGERMGLPQRDRDRLRWAALLHDIGKLRIPESLLNKPGKLTADEWEVMRKHPEFGEQIVEPLREWLGPWWDVVVQHHERWDGKGYPRGLAGTTICLGARVVAVADAYDVMTAARAYKKAIGRAAALRELVDCSGGQFDPAVVRALLATPRRQLMLVMGPLSWVVGLPLIGQANAVLAAAAAPVGVAGVAGAAVTAGAMWGPTPPPMHPPTPAAAAHVVSAPATPSATGATTPAPASTAGPKSTTTRGTSKQASAKPSRATKKPAAKSTTKSSSKPTHSTTTAPTPAATMSLKATSSPAPHSGGSTPSARPTHT